MTDAKTYTVNDRLEGLRALLEHLDQSFDRTVCIAAANAREKADHDGHKWKVQEREAFRAALRALISMEEEG